MKVLKAELLRQLEAALALALVTQRQANEAWRGLLDEWQREALATLDDLPNVVTELVDIVSHQEASVPPTEAVRESWDTVAAELGRRVHIEPPRPPWSRSWAYDGKEQRLRSAIQMVNAAAEDTIELRVRDGIAELLGWAR